MDRRQFLATTAAFSAATAAPAFAGNPASEGWRTFEVTTRIDIPDPASPLKVWVPLPSFSSPDWIRPGKSVWAGNAETFQESSIGQFGASALALTWANPTTDKPWVEVASSVATRDRSTDFTKSRRATLSAHDRSLYTSTTRLIPIDGIVRETALKITSGQSSDLERARALYEWVVVNTFRDAAVRGCGIGDIKNMLATGYLGGKCADLNALFVGMARSVGIPARDLYGIRTAPSRAGYKALGAASATITKSQHCRAEVFLEHYGWVPVDPADVRKVALEEPPGNLALQDPKVDAARHTLFGAWEGNWIAFNSAHDVALPGSAEEPVAFLMYPQAETAAGRFDCLNADTFKYTITVRET